eukprot:TRINITY_DN5033_c0_g1_i1.p1 TRINITY_DN5033_c0_g1~~TRINITY_DN5033_c0_g1_i1.p1  ORF type:complete len:639 (+),score=118.78 TRINITY_DN5033_c0_g1_i1:213-1919(+)
MTYAMQGKLALAIQVYAIAEQNIDLSEEEGLYLRICEARTSQYLEATMKGKDQERLESSVAARHYCNLAVTRHPKVVTGWATSGILYTELLEYEKALEYFYEGLKLDPENQKIHSSITTTHSRLGNFVESAKHARKAIEAEPEVADHWYSEGVLRSVAFHEDKQAMESYTKAVDLTAKARRTNECPSGYTAQYGWEDVPKNNKWSLEITVVEESNGEKFGIPKARLPASGEVPGVIQPNLEWTDRTSVIVKLRDVTLEGATGIYSHSSSCTVFSGGHKMLSKIHSEFRSNQNLQVKKIMEPVASILQQNPGNFYHFVTETFARFLYLYENVLNKPEHSDMKVIVPARARSLVEGFIVKSMGFPSSRLIWYDPIEAESVKYFLKEVYIADWYWPAEHDLHPYDLSATFFSPRKILQKIRQYVVPEEIRSKEKKPKLVYITREDASVRKVNVEDERELLVRLMDLVGANNVEWVCLEGLPTEKQVQLLADATIIVAPHGAGLTNMIWASPGTSVVQFPMKPNNDQVTFVFRFNSTSFYFASSVFSLFLIHLCDFLSFSFPFFCVSFSLTK